MRLLVTLVVLCVGAMGCPPPPPPTTPTPETKPPPKSKWGEAQRLSLTRVWYRGNPLPPKPTAAEIDAVKKRIEAARPHERKALLALYPNDPELWVYATRDTDADGVLDFRVSNYLGKFVEGDTDIDGDGLSNYEDEKPFERSRQAKGDRIPRALSWARDPDRSVAMADAQEALYRDYGVLLVERDAAFNEALVQATADALEVLLAKDHAGGLSTLKTIATETSSLLDPKHSEGASDFAQAFAESSSLSIYKLGIEAPSVIQLGLLSHEIAHSLQAALDEPRGPPLNFVELMNGFGWSSERKDAIDIERFTLFDPVYSQPDYFEHTWRDREYEEWLDVLDSSSLRGPEAKKLGIVGPYSLSNPAEWYADYVISYIYIELVTAAACGAEGRRKLTAWLKDTISDSWPDYVYDNAEGTAFVKALASWFPMTAKVRAELAERYLEPARFCGA